jgi:hypothetical protein
MTGRRAALLLVVASLPAACGEEDTPPVAQSCTGEPAEIVTALAAAPEAVELPDGARISDCLRNATTQADLQNVGVALSRAAEDLELRMLDGDADAALQLGYLVGAAREGASTTSGVGAELVRRLERSAAAGELAPRVEAALERGLAAGARRG